MKRGGNPDIPASESTDLSTDTETNKMEKLANKKNDVAVAYIVQVIRTNRDIRIIHKRKNVIGLMY